MPAADLVELAEQPADAESINSVDTTPGKDEEVKPRSAATEKALRQALEEFGGDADDEKSKAFLQRLLADLPAGKLDELQAASEAVSPEFIAKKFEGIMGSNPKPCILEGWWYEAEQPAAGNEHLSRLLSIAKASGASSAKAGDWETALDHYFSALEICVRGDNEVGTLHSNCSLACLKLGRLDDALEHAQTAVRIWPKWHKSHARQAAALEQLGRLSEASETYQEAQRHLNPKADKSAAAEISAALTRLEKALPRFEDITEAVCTSGGGSAGGGAASGPSPAVRGEMEAAAGTPRGVAWAAAVRAEIEAEAQADDDSDDDIGEPLDAPQSFEPRNAQLDGRTLCEAAAGASAAGASAAGASAAAAASAVAGVEAQEATAETAEAVEPVRVEPVTFDWRPSTPREASAPPVKLLTPRKSGETPLPAYGGVVEVVQEPKAVKPKADEGHPPEAGDLVEVSGQAAASESQPHEPHEPPPAEAPASVNAPQAAEREAEVEGADEGGEPWEDSDDDAPRIVELD